MQYLRSKMILTIRSLSCGTWPLLAMMLAACAPQYSRDDWTGLVSKSESLRFLAPASCDTPDLLNPVPADAAFFKINHLEPVKGEQWTYNAELVGENGVRRGKFVVSQWWTVAGVKTAPRDVTKDNKFCNVLAEVPVSRDGLQPYYVEPEAAKTAEFNAVNQPGVLWWFLVVVVCSAWVLSFWGFEHVEHWLKWSCVLIAVFVGLVVVCYFCIEVPWQEYQKALAYHKFFNELSRTASGDLLPISPQQLAYLAAGPTHPHSTQFHFEFLICVTYSLMGTWLLFTAPFVVMGIYWLVVPLPLEELHQRTLSAGRAPTAAEITAAVLGACTGKAAWQHRIMQRKADAFARNLNNIARHL